MIIEKCIQFECFLLSLLPRLHVMSYLSSVKQQQLWFLPTRKNITKTTIGTQDSGAILMGKITRKKFLIELQHITVILYGKVLMDVPFCGTL